MWQLTSPAFTLMLGWSSAWYGAYLVPALRLLGCTFQLLRIVRTALASYVRSSQARWLLAQHKGWSPCAQCWVAIQFSRCRLTDPGRNCVRFIDLWCPPSSYIHIIVSFVLKIKYFFNFFLLFFLYSLFILHPYYRLSSEKNQAFFPKFPVNFYIKSSALFYLFYHLFEYYYTTLMQ